MNAHHHLLFRLTILAIVCLGFVSAFADAVGPAALGAHPGTYGVPFAVTSVPGMLDVKDEPLAGSPARATIRRGDCIALGGTSVIAFTAPRAGDRVSVDVHRAQRCKDRTVAPTTSAVLEAVPDGPRSFDVEWAVIRMLTLAVALLVALAARPNDRTARALATFLACLGLLDNWRLYPGGLALAGFFARDLAMIYGFPYFIVFASRFTSSGQDRYTPRLFGVSYERIAAGMAAVFAIELFAKDVLYLRAQVNPYLDGTFIVAIFAGFALGLTALFQAVSHARGELRQRLFWVFATMAVSLSGAVAWMAMDAVEMTPSWRDPLALTTILLPIGLSYAILKHHVLDISFALNRAIVFTIIAAVLIPFFGLLEWILNELVKNGEIAKHPLAAIGTFWDYFSERDNRIVAYANAGASVLVFASLRYVHERIDRSVKSVLFRDRDRVLAELTQSCREIVHTTGATEAARYIVEIFDEKLHVSGTTVYLADENGVFERAATSAPNAPDSIPADDRAILHVKATEEIVLLAALESSQGLRRTRVPGAYLIPISSGPALIGVCAVPYGSSGKSLAPDELKAACEVARYAAYALEDFKLRDLKSQISELRGQLLAAAARAVPLERAAGPTSPAGGDDARTA
jgi:hypothetical protein